jgi:hypothetical protein
MKYLIYLLIPCLLISCKSKDENNLNSTVLAFPVTEKLKATIITVPPVLLYPSNMCISGDKMVILSIKEDTLFRFFQLPECVFLFGAGIRGGGPHDFPSDIDISYLQPTQKGFNVVVEMGLFREMEICNNSIIKSKERIINTDFIHFPINGFKKLNDTLSICMPDLSNRDFEYVLINSSKNTNRLFSPYPMWVNKQWINEMKPFIYIKHTVVHPSKTKFASFYAFFKHWRIYTEINMTHDISVDISPCSNDIEESLNERMVYYKSYPYASNEYIYTLCKNLKYSNNSYNTTELQIWKWDGNPVANYILDKKIDLFTVSEKDRKLYALNKDEGNEDKIYVYSIPAF